MNPSLAPPASVEDPPPAPPRFQMVTRLQLLVAALAMGIAFDMLLGSPTLGFLPVIAAAGAVALWVAPLRYSALGLFFISLCINSPGDWPADGGWVSPNTEIGGLLYENLNNLTGVTSLRFAGIEVVLVAFLLVIVWRRILGKPAGPPGPKPPLGLNLFLGASIATLFVLEGMGIASGGDFKASLWQIREMLWFPILVWLFQAAELGPRDIPILGLLLFLAALVKTAEGAYYYEIICRPKGFKPFYVTTHADTQLFVTAVVICIVGWLFLRRPARWALLLLATLPLFAIFINNRRLAFVSLAFDLALLYAALPKSNLKRAITRALLLSLPLVALYAAVGWNSTSPIFAPAHMLSTVASHDDASTATRDIENYNLIQTLKVHPFKGWGFGHEYLELSKAYDISKAFALYRYIGHNSVLWLFTIGGVFGFAVLWMPWILALFFSARCLLFVRDSRIRAGALVALTIPMTCMIQAFGDMGLEGWTGIFLSSVTLAVMSRTAVSVGAWPAVPVRRPRHWPGSAVARA